MKASLSLLLALMVPATLGFCQASLESITARFPNEVAVFTERSETMNILISADTLNVYSETYEETLHLKDEDPFKARKIYGSHFYRVENISASTFVPHKGRFKELPVTGIKKNSDTDDGIFYDDSYHYAFDFPSVTAGAKGELRYRTVYPDARFISGYIFPSYLPQMKSTFSIRTSPGVELSYKVVNDHNGLVKFEKFEKGGYLWYKWSASEVASIASETSGPSLRYYAPHVVCHIKSFSGKNGKVNVLSGLDDLYKWYSTFVGELPMEGSPEMKKIVDDLKASSSDELSIVRNVYGWVQDNIKYIAFEEGMRGFIPHSGTYVFEKRYGDCKDMASIIVNMLAIAGVKAHYTWIGTRDLPYKYSEYPTPLVDNHMIATYISPAGQYYFLDATDSYLPFGLPSSMIQGKEALIFRDDKPYEVVMVPEVPAQFNEMKDSIWISIDDASLRGRGTCTLAGFAKANADQRLDRGNQREVKEYIVRVIGKGSNKFILDDYRFANVNKEELLTELDYQFRIDDYFQKAGNEIYLNLNLSKDFFNGFINTDLRRTPVEIEYKYVSTQTVEFEIPSNFKVEYLPQSTRHDDQLLAYQISYEVKPKSIVYSRRLEVNYLLLTPEHFGDWNNSVRKLSEAYKESIILKEK